MLRSACDSSREGVSLFYRGAQKLEEKKKFSESLETIGTREKEREREI